MSYGRYDTGLFNDYTVMPRNLTKFTAFRGVTDFSNIAQFNQYEQGYQFLSVLGIPKFMEILGQKNPVIDEANKSFKHMLEYEFRGMDGLPDIQSDGYELTDGINTMRVISKVTQDTSITVSMNYFERSGSLITKYSEYYLTGIKDRITQAKTYHGIIADGTLSNSGYDPGFENEVFTLLYYATDNTMLRLERAILLVNAQLTKAETSMYAGSRDNITNKEMTIEFNAFPITGYLVDKAANSLLRDITGVKTYKRDGRITYELDDSVANPAALDSNDYRYGIMGGPKYSENGDNNAPYLNPELVNAINNAPSVYND